MLNQPADIVGNAQDACTYKKQPESVVHAHTVTLTQKIEAFFCQTNKTGSTQEMKTQCDSFF